MKETISSKTVEVIRTNNKYRVPISEEWGRRYAPDNQLIRTIMAGGYIVFHDIEAPPLRVVLAEMVREAVAEIKGEEIKGTRPLARRLALMTLESMEAKIEDEVELEEKLTELGNQVSQGNVATEETEEEDGGQLAAAAEVDMGKPASTTPPSILREGQGKSTDDGTGQQAAEVAGLTPETEDAVAGIFNVPIKPPRAPSGKLAIYKNGEHARIIRIKRTESLKGTRTHKVEFLEADLSHSFDGEIEERDGVKTVFLKEDMKGNEWQIIVDAIGQQPVATVIKTR